MVEAKNGQTVQLSLALIPNPAAKAPPEPAASGEVAGDAKVPAPTDASGGQGKPKQRAQWRPPRAKATPEVKPAPKAQPAPAQPNIQIIDESSEAKVKVDVIE
jgi:hypothetical protein